LSMDHVLNFAGGAISGSATAALLQPLDVIRTT